MKESLIQMPKSPALENIQQDIRYETTIFSLALNIVLKFCFRTTLKKFSLTDHPVLDKTGKSYNYLG